MAITHKDINLLTQKATIAGTEKIPVSDTEYVTPSQIASLGGGGGEENVIETVKVNGTALVPDANKAVDVPVPVVDSELSRTSTDAIQNKVVTFALFGTDEKTPTSTETGGYMKRDGDKYSVSNYAYKLYSVTEGRVYAFTIALGSGYTTGTIRAVVFFDSNGDVISYSDYSNSSSEFRAFINRLIVAPPGAVTAAVNYQTGYSWAGKLCLVSYATNAYVGSFAQTLTSAEQAQARTNIGAAAASDIPDSLSDLSEDSTHRVVTDTEKSTWNGKQNAITVSSSEPTAQDGSNGDIWIVV